MFELLENMPEMKYSKKTPEQKKYANDRIRHWGQLKLIMSEIHFLCKIFMENKSWPSKYVVYAGGAPGTHIQYLSILFPELCFILIDPRNFVFPPCSSFKKFTSIEDVISSTSTSSSTSIFTLNTYLTHISASQFKALNPIFISDIRSISEEMEESNNPLNELSVLFDTLLHIDILRVMDPCYSLIKFRCIYGNSLNCLNLNTGVPKDYTKNHYYEDVVKNFALYKEKTPYPEGTIYLQCWQGISSTETRLFVKRSNDIVRYYDNVKYENQLYHFNNVMRLSEYEYNECTDNEMINMSHDSFYHSYIIKLYKDFNKKELRNLKDFTDDMSKSITIDGKRTICTNESQRKHSTFNHIKHNKH